MSRLRVVVLLGAAASAGLVIVVLASGCGTVTGLSDDYQYSDDRSGGEAGGDGSGGGGDASGDGPTRTDAAPDAPGDAKPDNQPGTCFLEYESFGNADQVSLDCRACMATRCCPTLVPCSRQTGCNDVVTCVFACQSKPTGSPEKHNCVQTCTGGTPNVEYASFSGCVDSECVNGGSSPPCATLFK